MTAKDQGVANKGISAGDADLTVPWVAIFDCDGTLMDTAGPMGPVPFPPIPAMLTRLRHAGWLCAICTGRSRASVSHLIRRHGLVPEIVAVRTPDDGPSKPHPDSVLDVLHQIGGAIGQAVMIGDGPADMLAARNAGIPFIHAAWDVTEPGPAEPLAAVAVVRSIADLDRHLEALRSQAIARESA
ncbi:HAD family hydrolase [Fodinicurvata sp. EGI_FJ10296]|uniref:HAD family hydrolase n=1 Tax=Fodinicurvata sp. EGI_FJ10296 TaxID=3231908 RepID=UPI00345164C1